MKNFVGSALLILALGIGFGCSEDGTNSGSFQAIDSPIHLTVNEQLGGTRTLYVHAATEHLYGCANYSLVASTNVLDSTYTISFDNVLEPSVCSPGNQAARTDVVLGYLASGNYTLTLKVNGTTLNAPMTVTDTSLSVSGGTGRWTTFARTYTQRVPRNIIWGNMQSNDPNASAVFRSFNDSLVAAGAVTRVYTAGDYGYFQIDAAGAVTAPGSSSIFVKTFVYQYNGDITVLRELLRRYGASHAGQLDIYLYSGNGDSFQASVLASGG